MSAPEPPPCWEDHGSDPGRLSDEQVARIAKALAHPERVAILEQFDECRAHGAGEIFDTSARAQSTVSEHLRILREAGVLDLRRDGPRTWYCMDRALLRAFARAVEELAAVEVARSG